MKQIETPINAQHMKDGGHLRLTREPEAFIKVVTLVDSQRQVEKPSGSSLKAFAVALGARHAMMVGEVDVVGTEGRFSCTFFSSRRYSCFMCDTGPMAQRRWYQHASSAGHRRQVKCWNSKLCRSAGHVLTSATPTADSIGAALQTNHSGPSDVVLMDTDGAKPCGAPSEWRCWNGRVKVGSGYRGV